MHKTTLLAFFNELSKLGTAFSQTQYKKLYGPKGVRKGKGAVSSRDDNSTPHSTSLTNNDAAHNLLGSANRVGESRETPGGQL